MRTCLVLFIFVVASCTPRVLVETSFPAGTSPANQKASLNIIRQRMDNLYSGTEIQADSSGKVLFSIPMGRDTTSYRFLLKHRGSMRIYQTYTLAELKDSLDKMEETFTDTSTNVVLQDSVGKRFSKFLQDKNTNRSGVSASQPLLGRSKVLMRNSQTGAILGACESKDTSYVNKMLQYGRQSGILPQNIVFKWEIPQRNNLVALYGIRPPASYEPVTGEMIETSNVEISSYGSFDVHIKFKREFCTFWERTTRENVGKFLAMCIDDVIYFCPTVNSVISSGDTQISGGFSKEEAQVISTILKYGELPAALEIVNVEPGSMAGR